MKNITYILLLFSLSVFGQRPNNFNDSTYFARSVRFAVPPYIIQGAGNGKVLTSDANGRATWQTFSSSGVTQQALDDSIARLDSTINAIPILKNGAKIIEDTAYEITHADDGYFLYFPYETIVTHSVSNPLIEGDVIGVQFFETNSTITMDAVVVQLYLYSQSQSGTVQEGEVAIFQAIQDNEIFPLFGLKTDEYDGKLKSINRYLYDKLNSVDQRISDTATQIRSEITDTASSLHTLIDAKVSTTTLTDSLAKKTNKLISFSSYTTSDTLRLTDADKVIEMNVGSANNLVIPTNTAYAFPVGTQIVLIQIGAGQTTFVPASGVTVHSSGSKLKLTGQYSGATIIKKATNEWYLFGDITN